MLKDKDIICISVSDWLKPWGSKQHLMTELSRYNRILYLEYQSSLLDFIKYPRFFLRRLKYIKKLRKVNNNIYVYTLIPVFPFGYYSVFINKVNQLILGFVISKLIKKLKFKNPILWIYPPSCAFLIGRFNESMVIYHCAADFAHEKRNFLRRNTINLLERHLVKNAHIVLALTNKLSKRFKELNQNTFYFPSAVDIEYFEKIRKANTDEPADLCVIKKPRLGIVGYLDGNILDIGLLDYIVKVNTEWSIVMIGPLFRKTNGLLRLGKNKNVYFLGEKSPAEIPVYLKYLDICLIPYVRNEFTNNVSPLKLYEYLAIGKPVISTYFSDELNDFKDIVGIANDKEEFLKLVQAFLNHKNKEEKAIARINFASENSWQKRLVFLNEKIRCNIQ